MTDVLKKLKGLKRDELIGQAIDSEQKQFYKLLDPKIYEQCKKLCEKSNTLEQELYNYNKQNKILSPYQIKYQNFLRAKNKEIEKIKRQPINFKHTQYSQTQWAKAIEFSMPEDKFYEDENIKFIPYTNWKVFQNYYSKNQKQEVFYAAPDMQLLNYKGAFNRMTQGYYNDPMGKCSVHEKYFAEQYFKDINKKEQQDKDLTLLLLQKSIKNGKHNIKIPEKSVNGHNLISCDKNDKMYFQCDIHSEFWNPEYVEFKKSQQKANAHFEYIPAYESIYNAKQMKKEFKEKLNKYTDKYKFSDPQEDKKKIDIKLQLKQATGEIMSDDEEEMYLRSLKRMMEMKIEQKKRIRDERRKLEQQQIENEAVIVKPTKIKKIKSSSNATQSSNEKLSQKNSIQSPKFINTPINVLSLQNASQSQLGSLAVSPKEKVKEKSSLNRMIFKRKTEAKLKDKKQEGVLSLKSLFSDRNHLNLQQSKNNQSEVIEITNEEKNLENLMSDAKTQLQEKEMRKLDKKEKQKLINQTCLKKGIFRYQRDTFLSKIDNTNVQTIYPLPYTPLSIRKRSISANQNSKFQRKNSRSTNTNTNNNTQINLSLLIPNNQIVSHDESLNQDTSQSLRNENINIQIFNNTEINPSKRPVSILTLKRNSEVVKLKKQQE